LLNFISAFKKFSSIFIFRDFLISLGLPQYIEVFEAQNCKTMRYLEDLNWEDFEEMGVKKLGHLKRLSLALKKLKVRFITPNTKWVLKIFGKKTK
jgi:hypothetical protein